MTQECLSKRTFINDATNERRGRSKIEKIERELSIAHSMKLDMREELQQMKGYIGDYIGNRQDSGEILENV